MVIETPAPRPRRIRLIIAVLAGVALLGGAAVAVLVLSQFLGPRPSDETDVADILEEPHQTWTYDWVGDNDREFLSESPQITAIGDGRALVWADFDYSAYLNSEGGSTGWYKGYDAHYQQGYESGRQYADDLQAFQADTYPYTVPRPHVQAYFPEGAYDDPVDFRGFHDGFGDGSSGAAAGASSIEPPEPPAFTPEISAIDTASGQVVWSVDLAEVVEGTDHSSTYVAQDLPGTSTVAVVVSTYGVRRSAYTVVALDKATGAVRSQLTAAGPIGVAALDGDLVLSIADETGEGARVARYAPDALDRDPRWSADVDGTAYLTVGAGFVIVQGSENGTVLNGSDGSTASWGDDIDYETGYAFAGDNLIRISSRGSESFEIEGLTTAGESRWASPVEAAQFDLVEGRLFSADSSGGAYAGLQLVDAATGTALWEDAFAGDFDRILGIEGNSLLLQHGATVVVLDLGTGEETLRENLGEFFTVYEGATLYYVPTEGALKAYRYDKPGEVWAFDLGASQTVEAVGGRLAVVDSREGTLSALAAG